MGRMICITGMGTVTAAGIGIDAFDRSLREAKSGIETCVKGEMAGAIWAPLPEIDIRLTLEKLGINADLSGRIVKLGHRASKGMRSALVAAAEAWSQSECKAENEAVGLIVAGSNLNNTDVVDSYDRLSKGKQVRPSYASQFLDSDYVGMISEALAIKGEGYTVGGASASGGVALALARRALLSGDVSAVLVVGAPTILSPVEISALGSVGALRCKNTADPALNPYQPFDHSASGFVYGQGTAAVVLEPFKNTQQCRQRSLGLLRGSAMHLDSNHSTNPSVAGEIQTMKNALSQAGLQGQEIDLVNSHGTGSSLGDKVEMQALQSLFPDKENGPWVNASKAITGHCLSSAGIVEAVAVILQLRGGYMHANPYLERPISDKNRWLGKKTVIQDINYALSNSFGFGGINTCQIFGRLSTSGQGK